MKSKMDYALLKIEFFWGAVNLGTLCKWYNFVVPYKVAIYFVKNLVVQYTK